MGKKNWRTLMGKRQLFASAHFCLFLPICSNIFDVFFLLSIKLCITFYNFRYIFKISIGNSLYLIIRWSKSYYSLAVPLNVYKIYHIYTCANDERIQWLDASTYTWLITIGYIYVYFVVLVKFGVCVGKWLYRSFCRKFEKYLETILL